MKIIGILLGIGIIVLVSFFIPAEEKQYFAEQNVMEKTIKEVGPHGLFLASQYAIMKHDFNTAGELLAELSDRKDAPKTFLKDAYTILSAEGKIDEAAKYANKALETEKANLLPALIVMTAKAKENNYKEALAVLDKTPVNGLNKYFKAMLQSWLLYGEGKNEEALKKLEMIQESKVFEGAYNFHKALLNDLLENRKVASESYEKVLGKDIEKASIRSSQVAISFYRRNNQPEKALEILEAYRRDPQKQAHVGEDFLYPKNDTSRPIATPNQGLAETLLGIAANLSTTEDYDVALVMMQMSLFLDPDLTVGKILLAEILEKEKMFDAAEKIYANLPKVGGLYFAGQMRRAEILSQKKEYEKAIPILRELIDDFPYENLPLIALADAYRNLENFAEATDLYTKVINNAGNGTNLPWDWFYARGVCFERIGNWELAEMDLLTALAKNPSNPLVLNYLGYSWLEKGKNIEKAKEMIAKAVEQSPYDGFIMDSFGWAFYKTGDYEKAVKVLELALELEPGNSLINAHLGDAYWKMGRKREARFQWQKALNFNVDFKESDIEQTKYKIENGLDAFLQKEKADGSFD